MTPLLIPHPWCILFGNITACSCIVYNLNHCEKPCIMYKCTIHDIYLFTNVLVLYSLLFISRLSSLSNTELSSWFWGSFWQHCLTLLQGVWLMMIYAIAYNKGEVESNPIRNIPASKIQHILLCDTKAPRKQLIAKINISTVW